MGRWWTGVTLGCLLTWTVVAEPVTRVHAVGESWIAGKTQCPDLTLESIEEAKIDSTTKALRHCGQAEVYPLRAWEVTSTCEKNPWSTEEPWVVLAVHASNEFVCF